MTQFQKRTHPARDMLEHYNRQPDAADVYAGIAQRRQGADFAPCYVDALAATDAVVEAHARIGGQQAVQMLLQAGPLAVSRVVDGWTTMATWRMTQGIYRFDPALYQPLIDTPLDDELPAELLQRLPEWCVYVETPDLTLTRRDSAGETPVLGAWARLNREPDGSLSLVIGLNLPGHPMPLHQHLPLRGTLNQGIRTVLDGWGIAQPDATRQIRGYLQPIVNLLLYLCSVAPDISGKGQPGNPAPKRTKQGWRLFPADGPTTWSVGVRVGAALRQGYTQAESGSGDHNSPRPHIRRAHWHTFRLGPKKSPDGTPIATAQRQYELRWMPPVVVNASLDEDLPATVKAVKPREKGSHP